MPRSVAIVIGVHKPDGMRELPGALTDASAMARWARGAGYDECSEFLDADGARVRAVEISDVIDGIVAAQDTERLLIYFSGHGVSKGVGIDYWILSNGVNHPNGPVNLDLSLRLARRSGIPHVIVLADACRTTATTKQVNIEGYTIFADHGIDRKVHLDLFSATLTGDPAIEQASQSALDQSHGIFTRCLIDALNGSVPSVLEEDATHIPRRAVVARNLEQYIGAAVASAAARLDPSIRQVPDAQPGSYFPPEVIGWVPDPGPPGAVPDRGWDPDAVDSRVVSTVDIDRARHELEAAVNAEARGLSGPGRMHFETLTGLSVLGAPVLGVAMSDPHDDPWLEDGAFHVRGAEKSGVAVLDLGDDRFACTAMLRGYIGTVHVGAAGVNLVSYLPAPGSDAFESDADNDQTREELAVLGAASRVGFRNWAITEARDYATRFRDRKFRNPSYGIFAAYAYDRSGDTEQVEEMLEYFRSSTGDVVFDFALLSDRLVESRDMLVPASYPLLSRGWGLVQPDLMHPIVRAAGLALASSAWATTTGPAGRALFDAVAAGEIR